MNTSVVVALDTRYQKDDGTYPIILRIIHFGKSFQIGTKLYIHQKDWDNKKRIIKNSYKGSESVTRLNNYLQKKKAEILDSITKLEEEKKLLDINLTNLKNIIEKKRQVISFKSYTNSIITDFENIGKIGTAKSYTYALQAVLKFTNQKDIHCSHITYQFLKDFEYYFLAKGNSLNGLAVIMRTVRAIINRAIKEELLEASQYPFKKYLIKTQKTRKRAIESSAITRIIDTKLTKSHPLFHTRNYFLASFYMRGIPFADLAQLTIGNIIEDRIIYQRKKTAKPYNIKITATLQQILDIYLENRIDKSEYIFPIINTQDSNIKQYNEVSDARKRYNKKLKQLAILCGIEEHLTSYVSRHSFASHAKNLGVPVATISDMLGHESLKTTEVYLDSLPDYIMDDFHEKVIQNLASKQIVAPKKKK